LGTTRRWGRDAHRTVVYLPLCHILGRDLAITLPLLGRIVPHYGEDIEDLPTTFFEVAPTLLFTVPRYLQKFASQVLVGINTSTKVKRAAFEWAMRGRPRAGTGTMGAQRARIARLSAVPRAGLPSAAREARHGRTRVGHLRRRAAAGRDDGAVAGLGREHGRGLRPDRGSGRDSSVGSRVRFRPPATWAPWRRAGNCSWATATRSWFRGPHVFDGYWNNDEATRLVKDADGWVHTGDVGELRNGVLRLVDRARDFIVTPAARRFRRRRSRTRCARAPTSARRW